MNEVIIGKYTLESLTSGMYSDPYIIFREYIQNAVDSIDEALAAGTLKKGEDKILVELHPLNHKISITDNGCGISATVATKTLISIGNSNKDINKSRGFRGIGRLAGLSYCDTLVFETTAAGEPTGTRISINSKRLLELISSTNNTNMTVSDVLIDVCSFDTYSEQVASHYFRVTLLDVDDTTDLLNTTEVYDYIAQTCPVPFDSDSFLWGTEIHRRLISHQQFLPEYRVFLCHGADKKEVLKLYSDKFCIDKTKGEFDNIHDVEIIKLNDSDGGLMAIGWIAKTSFLGTIPDKRIKGIRLRKGNMLIGDHQTLNTIFKDARFNGWSIGEVYVQKPNLLPNARRDNLEKNPTYFMLVEQLMSLASNITKEIRVASVNRNSELATAIKKVQETKQAVDAAITNGANSAVKGILTQKTSQAKQTLQNTGAKNDNDIYLQEIAFEELDLIIGRLQGITSFKSLNTIETLTKTEKKILEKVFNVIITCDGIASSELIEKILSEFSKNVTGV